MKRRVTFIPQAWVRDQAIDVDAEGETAFYVDNAHLKRYTPDALKYELEPYQDLPNLPEWIREWRGPFWFDVEDEPELVTLDRESAGAYRHKQWSIQCPHALDANDPDRHWYATSEDGEALGPFDTLHEARVYLTRYDSIDDWRGDLCGALRDLGRDELADEIGGISDQEAMVYRDTDDDPIAIARQLHAKHPPQPTRYQVTIADTYTHYRTLEVEATSETEARQAAEREYERAYDAASVFEAFAMSGAEGEHRAIEARPLEPHTA